MILQENEIRIEITEVEILIMIIMVIIFVIIVLAMFLHTYINDRLHKQYHKGYNKAKSDKVQYYSTLKTLLDDFKEIILNLERDNIKPSIITTALLIDFKTSLKDYYNN